MVRMRLNVRLTGDIDKMATKSWLSTRGDEIELLVVAMTRRMIWPRWRSKLEAMARAAYYLTKPRRTKLYECENCHRDGLKPIEIHCHHVVPVTPKTGFDNLEDTIRRILCEADGIRVLCKKCHLEIHAGDAQVRADNRKKPKARKAKTKPAKRRGKQ